MANHFFQFKQFIIQQDRCAMKVSTDACLFGAWAAADLIKDAASSNHILDIGTGTGLLSLMLAQKLPLVSFIAIELDRDASNQARENIAASPWTNNISVFYGDAKKFEKKEGFDFIIANPPFYENELQSADPQKNLARHSLELTLDELFKVIANNLKKNGRFFLLLPFKRDKEIQDIFREYGFEIEQIVRVRQTVQHGYFRIMLCGKINTEKNEPLKIQDICIRNEADEYSEDFKLLLKDYYLRI